MRLPEGKGLTLLAAAIVVVNGFFPAVWILLTSLKTEAELVSKPITWWPRDATLANYVQAFTDQPLLRYLGNSFAVAVLSTILSLFVGSLAAYAIARLFGEAGRPDSDGDGVYDDTDQWPDTPKGAKVDAVGCPKDSDGDGVWDGIDRCPDTPKGTQVDATGCPVDEDGDCVLNAGQVPRPAEGRGSGRDRLPEGEAALHRGEEGTDPRGRELRVQQRHADEGPAPLADLAGQRRLGHGHATGVARSEDAGEQDDHRGAGAHDQRIDENAEGLDDALVAGMGDVGDGGDVRRDRGRARRQGRAGARSGPQGAQPAVAAPHPAPVLLLHGDQPAHVARPHQGGAHHPRGAWPGADGRGVEAVVLDRADAPRRRRGQARDRRERALRPHAQGPVDDGRPRSPAALRVGLRAEGRARRGEVRWRQARDREGSHRLDVAMPKLAEWMAQYGKDHPELDEPEPEEDL